MPGKTTNQKVEKAQAVVNATVANGKKRTHDKISNKSHQAEEVKERNTILPQKKSNPKSNADALKREKSATKQSKSTGKSKKESSISKNTRKRSASRNAAEEAKKEGKENKISVEQAMEEPSEENSFEQEAQRIKDKKLQKWAQGEKEMMNKISRFDGLNSIYGVAENYPTKFKEFVEELISYDDEG